MEQQFLQLVQIVAEMQQKIVALEQTNHVLVQANKQMLELIETNQREFEDYQRNAVFEINAVLKSDTILEINAVLGGSSGRSDETNDWHPIIELENKTYYWYPIIESEQETIRQIIQHGKSLSRFGDGEFSTIEGRIRHRFQNQLDARLQERLKEVLQSHEDKLLIGLADNYGSLEKYTEQAKKEIRRYLNPQVRQEHLALLEQGRTYYNAYVTRPYVMYKDNQENGPQKRFEQLKKIWQGRTCIVVEGLFTGTGVGNNLLDGAGSIKRILGPAENAFDKYDELLMCCKRQPKNVLFLLALGPTAAVLAYDLCKAGYQAVDIGHIDLEYEWFLRGKGYRVLIEGKYNNELPEVQQLEPIKDELYCSQVIENFS